MSWAVGYDENWARDIGYGVPSICDHPDCTEKIDRGLGYVCGGQPYGGESGCGLFFCSKHLFGGKCLCEKCVKQNGEIDRDLCFEPKPDTQEWVDWKLTDDSWKEWRDENPDEVEKLRGHTHE